MNKTLTALFGAILLAGCSTSPSTANLVQQQLETEQLRNEAVQAKAEKELSQVPEWVIAPPKNDDLGVFAVGIGESYKLNNAIKKSSLDGQYGLAKALKQEVSGNERSYSKDTGNSHTEQYTQLIDSLVDSVPVHGYDVVDQKIVVLDGKYHSYRGQTTIRNILYAKSVTLYL
ncbi:hypothetical protein [Vibrio parahaemolyticus]|uniref:hypothetical protein n=1 Tax=Vibrio parahaemolyticus TaxID=670 RepID=UPI0011226CEF|nr:hypothetical protein [Vibrio parahaemolyticus]TOD43642.1 hypothetical protein CGJ64_22480 [Vibrio parahaemolyticus]